MQTLSSWWRAMLSNKPKPKRACSVFRKDRLLNRIGISYPMHFRTPERRGISQKWSKNLSNGIIIWHRYAVILLLLLLLILLLLLLLPHCNKKTMASQGHVLQDTQGKAVWDSSNPQVPICPFSPHSALFTAVLIGPCFTHSSALSTAQ